MHHISPGKDTNKALNEISRVLKPGGRVGIYDDPYIVFLWTKLLRKNGLTVERKERNIVFCIKPALSPVI